MNRILTGLLLILAPVAAVADDGLGPERLVGTLLERFLPKHYEPATIDGLPGKFHFKDQAAGALFPWVETNLDWSLRTGAGLDATAQDIPWVAVAFSPFHKYTGMNAKKSGRRMVIFEPVPPLDFMQVDRLLFRPGLVVSYQNWQVVAGGKPGPTCDRIGWVTFSDDGKHIGYLAKQGGEWSVVVDGKAGRSHAWVDKLVFAPGGKRFAYCAMEGSSWRVVVNDERGPPFSRGGSRGRENRRWAGRKRPGPLPRRRGRGWAPP